VKKMGMHHAMGALALLLVFVVAINGQTMPCPFTRVLTFQKPLLSGDDVFILQSLLKRVLLGVQITYKYDNRTATAVEYFQEIAGLNSKPGVFDETTATALLGNFLDDNYQDDGIFPDGVLYKVYIPVYKNRSIETNATLFAGNGTSLLNFTVRTQGQVNNDTGVAISQLCTSGETPTGLITFDLNSPEPDPTVYGPYPINRAVQGMQGNAAIVLSNIRDGILMHTGHWADWSPPMPMPNSHGCIHAYPQDIKEVWQILVSLGVQVHNNTYGKLPYPYPTQGILSIEQID